LKIDHVIDIPIKDLKKGPENYYIKVYYPNRETVKTRKVNDSFHPLFKESF